MSNFTRNDSCIIANVGREVWLLALRGRYYISREKRQGNMSRQMERLIPVPPRIEHAAALAVFYAQCAHWGIENKHARYMGRDRYQVFPIYNETSVFLIDIFPGDTPEYRIEDLSPDLKPIRAAPLRSWLKKMREGIEAVPYPWRKKQQVDRFAISLHVGRAYLHCTDNGRRYAVRIEKDRDPYTWREMLYIADIVLLPEKGDAAENFWRQAVAWGIPSSSSDNSDSLDQLFYSNV